MAMVEIWWLPLVTNRTNNGSEWQVWEMHMAITMSIGERTELPPVARSSDYHGNVRANGPKSLTILNHSMCPKLIRLGQIPCGKIASRLRNW